MDLINLAKFFKESQHGREETHLGREPRIEEIQIKEEPVVAKKAKMVGKNLLQFIQSKTKQSEHLKSKKSYPSVKELSLSVNSELMKKKSEMAFVLQGLASLSPKKRKRTKLYKVKTKINKNEGGEGNPILGLGQKNYKNLYGSEGTLNMKRVRLPRKRRPGSIQLSKQEKLDMMFDKKDRKKLEKVLKKSGSVDNITCYGSLMVIFNKKNFLQTNLQTTRSTFFRPSNYNKHEFVSPKTKIYSSRTQSITAKTNQLPTTWMRSTKTSNLTFKDGHTTTGPWTLQKNHHHASDTKHQPVISKFNFRATHNSNTFRVHRGSQLVTSNEPTPFKAHKFATTARSFHNLQKGFKFHARSRSQDKLNMFLGVGAGPMITPFKNTKIISNFKNREFDTFVKYSLRKDLPQDPEQAFKNDIVAFQKSLTKRRSKKKKLWEKTKFLKKQPLMSGTFTLKQAEKEIHEKLEQFVIDDKMKQKKKLERRLKEGLLNFRIKKLSKMKKLLEKHQR